MEGHSEGESNDAGEAVAAFFGNFGEMDIYAKIVLEEFMEALLSEK
jgi:hypothetical protein